MDVRPMPKSNAVASCIPIYRDYSPKRFELADGKQFWLRGKIKCVLIMLMEHRGGITAADAFPMTTGLSEFVSELRYRHRITIATTLEPNVDGKGRHARYNLRSSVKLTAMEG